MKVLTTMMTTAIPPTAARGRTTAATISPGPKGVVGEAFRSASVQFFGDPVGCPLSVVGGLFESVFLRSISPCPGGLSESMSRGRRGSVIRVALFPVPSVMFSREVGDSPGSATLRARRSPVGVQATTPPRATLKASPGWAAQNGVSRRSYSGSKVGIPVKSMSGRSVSHGREEQSMYRKAESASSITEQTHPPPLAQ